MSPHPPATAGPVPDGADPEAYDRLRRRVLWALPTGLYVIGSRGPGDGGDPPGNPRANLMTANLVVQVATEPKLLAVAVEEGSVTAGLIAAGGGFTVSLLDRQDRAVVRKFVKPVAELATDQRGHLVQMAGVAVTEAPGGVPVLAQALAWVACQLRQDLPLGSHRLFIGEVTAVGAGPGLAAEPSTVLRMADTRMNYGG